ncbi:MAG: ATP-binding protein [Pirellulales bacterium]|jgi:hypothetical protein|nr:ATP-binding protein [Thermoguttaceae bacterium]MDD4786924.1 ATP-binding protein [Pirellulales bacterium]NLZ01300.1 ATP-binding protein [Pirellulaceae bacterium]
MQDFEKLGVFYLGRQFDPASRSLKDELVLYDSKDLVTHAVCVGMTGSGKTGLCLTLLEEAAIDGIPAILVDPKGDLGNLLLTFPRLESADFRPWIDEAEAARQGITPEQLAEATAKKWREGLAEWGQDAARIERFRSSVDLAIYTPGSSAGLPLAVLRAFTVPPRSMLDQPDALRERIASAVSGLLALLGIAADPLNSREHILLAQIFEHAWREGRDLDLAGLVRAIQSPPFDKMGLVDLETFFPAKDRTALAMQINNLLASPGFAGWLEGEPLDIQRLLYTPEGKPRLSIISIAHLSDAERMFFVTILLGEMISWMRSQSGTTSLRAVFYMDEVFGYFPPTANPPTKTPMLTLLKQARAFGLGVVLATQNPVDLDYKGLSNAGTWLLGRLQTERDKLRVLEGLEGASAAAGAQFNRKDMEAILAGLGNRVFLMNNVHEDQPVVFQTRWCLSYLGGPLSRGQIQSLMAPRKQAAAVAATPPPAVLPAPAPPAAPQAQRPIVPPEAGERFFACRARPGQGERIEYRPTLLGTGKVHYVNAKRGVDLWQECARIALLGEQPPADVWEDAESLAGGAAEFDDRPEDGAAFASAPAAVSQARQYARWLKDFQTHLHRNESLPLWTCPSLREDSKPGESQADFRLRLGLRAREARDASLEDLRRRYAARFNTLKDQLRRAEERVAREKSQSRHQAVQTAVSIGASILGAFLGRKVVSKTSLSSAASAVRSAGRAAREHQDVGRVQENVAVIQQRLADLEAEFEAEVNHLETAIREENLVIEAAPLRPRKADISDTNVILVWAPYRVDTQDRAQPAWQ